MIAMPGKRIRVGTEVMNFRSAAIIEPHSARGGWAPRPTKESAATSRIAPPIPRVPWTISGVRAFGRMRRKRIPLPVSPRAFDAVT